MELQLPGATEQQLREFVSIQQQARLLIKDPERKYTDQFKSFIRVVIYGAILLLIQFVLIQSDKYTGFMYVLIGCTLLMTILGVLSIFAMKKRLKYMLEHSGPCTVRFSPEEMEDVLFSGDKVTVQWSNFGFVRIFKEMIVFFPKSIEGVIIGIDAQYAPMILDYLRENNINIRIVAGEKK